MAQGVAHLIDGSAGGRKEMAQGGGRNQNGIDASIIIKDDKKGGNSELSAFSDLNIFSGKTSSFRILL